jgi:hypothetical protein
MIRQQKVIEYIFKNDNKMSEVKKDEYWKQKKWLHAMCLIYLIVCILDIAIFPVLWSLVQVLTKQPITQWNPLTLQGAGLFHLAMGAVLGIAAWGRTQEKVAGAANNTPLPSSPSPISSPSPLPSMSGAIGAPIGGPITPLGSNGPSGPAPLGPPPANQPAL